MMLFDDGDAALLKKWIVKRLEDMYVLLFSPSLPPLSSPPSLLQILLLVPLRSSPGVRRWAITIGRKDS